MSASFNFHRLADINVRSTINSCMTVKEIVNELERTLAAKPVIIANSSLGLTFLGVLLIALTVHVDRIHPSVPLAFSSGCGSWPVSCSPIFAILQSHTIPPAPDLATLHSLILHLTFLENWTCTASVRHVVNFQRQKMGSPKSHEYRDPWMPIVIG